jgi:hypothetical protein
MGIGKSSLSWLMPMALASLAAAGQEMPKTAGDTLSGKRIVLADEVRGHFAVVVAGFSREGGNGTAAWVKAIHADSTFTGMPVYQITDLAGAPSLIRGMIKSGMKKGVPAAEQDHFVVLTQDDKTWRSYFGVDDEKVPYVALIDATGKVVWRGHGGAADLEPQLKAAIR